MKERIKTLLLDANGAKPHAIFVNTVLRGVLGVRNYLDASSPLNRLPFAGRVLGKWYDSASYMLDWREAFDQSPALEVENCNISNLFEYARFRRAVAEYPLIIILHSAAGDDLSLLLRTVKWFQRRRGKLVVFLGNEYDLMSEKSAFLKAVSADFVCTQLPIESARWLYGELTDTRILEMPHALNPRVYFPTSSRTRSIDIGFVGDLYPHFIGDVERTNLIYYFQTHAPNWNLSIDIRFQRMSRLKWAEFLRHSAGTIGGESGTYYLDRRGEIVNRAKAFTKKNPHATFEQLWANCFHDLPPFVSGRAVSSRHFEPIGTKTCQILLEGNYNHILQPEEHYIAVKKDLSNIDEAVRRFKDKTYRDAIVERTYEYAMDQHTYAHRVNALINAVVG